MARRSNRRTWIIKIAFIALVVVSGVALAQTGDLRNPFTVFSRLTGNQVGGFGRERFEREERPEGFNPPTGDAAQGSTGGIAAPQGFRRGERPEGFGREGRGIDDAITLNWNAFDGVLFDFWFIAAAAAVIMVIGPLVGKLIKKLRPPRRPNRPQTAVV